MNVTIYLESTIQGPVKKAAAGMYLIEYILQDGTPVTRKDVIYQEETTEQAIILILLIAALQRLTKPCSVLINTRSDGILAAFENEWVEQWHDRGWKKANGKPIQNAELWQQAYEEMAKHEVLVVNEGNTYYPGMKTEMKEMLRRHGHV